MFTEYKGMNIGEISELRNRLRAANIQYKVVKNTLARKASEGTSIAVGQEKFKGPMGVAMTEGDVAVLAKNVLEFSKQNNKLVITGAVMEGRLYDETALKAIATLPNREVMLSMMAGTFQAPASQMARLLNATVVRFAYAMTALKEKRAASGA